MQRSLYTAATGMDAQQVRMDLIANNLANVNTTGFKRARPEFEDLLSETLREAVPVQPQGGTEPGPLQVGLGVRLAGSTRQHTQGDLVRTGNQLDLAIEGTGFFRIQRANGELAYTRAGNFRLDAEGRITTQRGELLDPGLTVPEGATALTVQPDGVVFATVAGRDQPVELGAIELTVFQNPAGLLSLGGNLFAATVASGEPLHTRPGEYGAGTLAQGALESSNVRAVEEMIDMIATQRAYELNSKVIQTADQMLQRLTALR